MSENLSDPGHGDSVAAWTSVVIILIAFMAGTLFFWLEQPNMVWACAGVAVLGLLIGWILRKAGYGVGGSKSKGAGH
jgi:hypothetical protein